MPGEHEFEGRAVYFRPNGEHSYRLYHVQCAPTEGGAWFEEELEPNGGGDDPNLAICPKCGEPILAKEENRD